MTGDDDCTRLQMKLMTLSYTLKMVKMAKYVFISTSKSNPHNKKSQLFKTEIEKLTMDS